MLYTRELKMIKTIIFDIGNVLVLVNQNKMFYQLSQLLNLSFADLKEQLFKDSLIQRFETGLIPYEELFNPNFPREKVAEAMNSAFSENSEMIPIINALKRQGKKLILLSNTNEIHFPYLQRHFSYLNLFDEAILSFEVKHIKPEREIFETALQKSGSLPEECFFVDDIFEHIQAARQLGIDAELYQDIATFRRDLAKRMIFV